jgi:hypothetical protein
VQEETEWSGVACRARELVDVYVGVVRKNEEDVVGINADANVVRDAEANKKWQVSVD